MIQFFAFLGVQRLYVNSFGDIICQITVFRQPRRKLIKGNFDGITSECRCPWRYKDCCNECIS